MDNNPPPPPNNQPPPPPLARKPKTRPVGEKFNLYKVPVNQIHTHTTPTATFTGGEHTRQQFNYIATPFQTTQYQNYHKYQMPILQPPPPPPMYYQPPPQHTGAYPFPQMDPNYTLFATGANFGSPFGAPRKQNPLRQQNKQHPLKQKSPVPKKTPVCNSDKEVLERVSGTTTFEVY